jgi:hypothetical protein
MNRPRRIEDLMFLRSKEDAQVSSRNRITGTHRVDPENTVQVRRLPKVKVRGPAGYPKAVAVGKACVKHALAECHPSEGHRAVADLPSAGLPRDNVVVHDAAGRPVGPDADYLGSDPRRVFIDLRDYDVGDVMADRIGVAQRE